MSTDAWTALGTWVGSIGAAGAFLIAAVVYLRSQRAETRKQARLVSINQTSSIDKVSDGSTFKPNTEAALYQLSFHAQPDKKDRWRAVGDVIWTEVTLQNGSEETITDVRMVGTIEPDGTEVPLPRVIDCPPGHVFQFDVVVPDPAPTYRYHRLALTVEFTDAGGRMWRRASGRPLQHIRAYSIQRTSDRIAEHRDKVDAASVPKNCPTCGAEVVQPPQEPDGVARVWMCANSSCVWTSIRLG